MITQQPVMVIQKRYGDKTIWEGLYCVIIIAGLTVS